MTEAKNWEFSIKEKSQKNILNDNISLLDVYLTKFVCLFMFLIFFFFFFFCWRS